MLLVANPTGGLTSQLLVMSYGQVSYLTSRSYEAGAPGNTPLDAFTASSLSVIQGTSLSPRGRWRASKGSAPVNRFTRSFGSNATEGWHRSLPVGVAGGTTYYVGVGGAVTLTASDVHDMRLAVEALLVMAAVYVQGTIEQAVSASLATMAGTTQRVARHVAAALSAVATVTRRTARRVWAEVEGSIFEAFRGSLTRRTLRRVSAQAMVAASGVPSVGTLLSAAITVSGTAVRTLRRQVSTTIASSAMSVQRAARTIAAAVGGATTTHRDPSRGLGAEVSGVGAMLRALQATAGASVTSSGAVVWAALRQAAAVVIGSGAPLRAMQRLVSSTFAAAGAVGHRSLRGVAASIAGSALPLRRTARPLPAATTASAALEQTSIVTLVPDSTPSNSGWSAVGAGSLHAALVAGDSDYMHSTSGGSVATVTLSNPSTGLTLSAGTLRVRARTE